MGADNRDLSISISANHKDQSFQFRNNAVEERGKSNFVKSYNIKLGSNDFNFNKRLGNKSVAFNNKNP